MQERNFQPYESRPLKRKVALLRTRKGDEVTKKQTHVVVWAVSGVRTFCLFQERLRSAKSSVQVRPSALIFGMREALKPVNGVLAAVA
jgi:hypothetical protein